MSAVISGEQSVQQAALDLDRSDWDLVSFGDVALKQNTSVDRENTTLTRYIAGEHMGSEDLHLRKWGEITEDYLGPAFTRKFEEGDILYGSRRTYLRKVAVARFDGITANTTFVIKPNEELILKKLLPFLMMSEGFTQHSIRNSKGSVNPYVNWKDIASYELLLPPMDQQAKLAELLWAADKNKESATELPERLRAVQKSKFESLGSQNSDSIIELGDALEDIVAGKSAKGMSRPATESEYGVLKVSAVGKEAYVEMENKALVSDKDFRPEYEVETGFVLVTRANALPSGVGRPCLVERTRKGLMLCDKTLRLVPKSGVTSERFLYQNLLSRRYRGHVESVIGGTEAKNISQARLRKAPIWNPPKDIQEQIVESLMIQDHAISAAENNMVSAKAVLKSLINQIF